MLPVIGELRPWTDPEVVSINRLPMRPPSAAFDDLDTARDPDAAPPWRKSLDGRWRFALFHDPDRVPPAAVRAAEPDGEAWRRVDVPGNWTVQGVGDLPHYTNVQMPFEGPPPALPSPNPTGVYRRSFTVPKRWNGRQLVLHLGGAESVHAVFVNGRFVGYGTDSRLASEYDVSAHVQPGRNVVAVVVVRYSAHSYVEDQDQWWMAGLHREVFIEARAPIHLRSLNCLAGLRLGDGVGTLTATVTVDGIGPPPGYHVRMWVESLGGRHVGRTVTRTVPDRFDAPYEFEGHLVRGDFVCKRVVPWSAERPERYRFVAELLDASGRLVEVHTQLVGFRDVRTHAGELLVNGRPVWVFGVNRHDHHPVRGTALTVDDLRADLLEMRRHNITWVRAAHYPNDPAFLDLCDELGVYVIDEANIEAHAYNTSLCDDPRYRSTWLARGSRMVERDLNHPCVVAWSLGNESGYGGHHDALAAWIRRTDPSRLLHYEGAVFHAGWRDGGTAVTDLVCPMYPSIAEIEAYDGTRPLVMCEYQHAMGNSNGSLADYWDTVVASPRLQGGFIWEWKDHGLLAELPSGATGFAHGGHFGDEPNDANFVADGLVSSDLVPHPAMQEVAWAYRPVAVSAAGRSKLRIENRQAFTGLDGFAASWELLVDGAVVDAGDLDVPDVEPLGSVRVPLPVTPPDAPDVVINVRFTTRRATPWAPSGHLVAWDEVVVRAPRRRRPPRHDSAGAVADLVISPPEPCLMRAPTDNDGFKLMPELHRRIGVGGTALITWQDLGIDVRPAAEVLPVTHEVEHLDDGSEVHVHTFEVPDDLDDLPRLGATFRLGPGFDVVEWSGRGPLENYPDRRRGALVGRWRRPVDEPPYLVPQEFGLRTDCRWFRAIRGDGAELTVEAMEPSTLHCSATHFGVEDLYHAPHETALVPRDELVVHVDLAHRGLGTASCGPDVLDRYRVPTGSHRFAYRLVRTA